MYIGMTQHYSVLKEIFNDHSQFVVYRTSMHTCAQNVPPVKKCICPGNVLIIGKSQFQNSSSPSCSGSTRYLTNWRSIDKHEAW